MWHEIRSQSLLNGYSPAVLLERLSLPIRDHGSLSEVMILETRWFSSGLYSLPWSVYFSAVTDLFWMQ